MPITVRNKQGETRLAQEEKISLAERDGFYPVVSDGKQEKLVKFENIPKAKASGFNLLTELPQAAAPVQPEQTTLAGQINKGIKEVPEAVGSGIGFNLAGPVGSGVGAVIGKSASDLASGIESAYKDPERFLNDLSRLPTKEQVMDQLGNYANTFSLNALIPALAQKVFGASQQAPQALKQSAEKYAENATGATRVQAEKFKPGSGRELLDRGVVGFGDTAESISKKSKDLVKQAESRINNVLTVLDEKGAKVNQNDIINEIEKKASEIAKDPASANVVKKLRTIVEDILSSGESEVTATAAETTKRNYNAGSKAWLNPSQDTATNEANKIAYRAYMKAVEDTAKKFNVDYGDVFKEAKQVFGLMKPIEEAATKRATQLNQSPLGGFLDVATAGGTGAAVGGIEGFALGLTAAAARRAIAPRLGSVAAVTLDKTANALKNVPQYAKLAKENPQVFTALANSVFNSFKDEESKINLSGSKALQNAGFDPVIIEQLQARPDGKKILEEASGVSPNSKAMEAIKKQIEALKLPRQKSSSAYPLIMRKDGLQATIFSDRDYKEAKSEGWA